VGDVGLDRGDVELQPVLEDALGLERDLRQRTVAPAAGLGLWFLCGLIARIPSMLLDMRVVLVLCVLPALVRGDEAERCVSGTVLDPAGKPLAGAEVAERWVFRADGRHPTGACARTDAHGSFRIVVPAGEDLLTVVAYSRDESVTGMAQVLGHDAQHVVIRMAPAVRVEIHVRTAQDGPAPESVQVAWHACLGREQLGPVVVQAASWSGLLKCALPQGKYEWVVSDIDWVTRTGKADLGGKESSVALHVLLPPSFVARHMGRHLPEWTVTEARGVASDAASLASFRGKWTFIEFWAFS